VELAECMAEETEVLGENLPQFRFVSHNCHMTSPGFEPCPPLWKPATNRLNFITSRTIAYTQNNVYPGRGWNSTFTPKVTREAAWLCVRVMKP
jgi:hypothetical protein